MDSITGFDERTKLADRHECGNGSVCRDDLRDRVVERGHDIVAA